MSTMQTSAMPSTRTVDQSSLVVHSGGEAGTTEAAAPTSAGGAKGPAGACSVVVLMALDLWRPVGSGLRCRSVGTSRRDVRGLGGKVVLSPTPQLWEVPTMAQIMSLVGLDVHASQTHAAVARHVDW
jgi:hypothetical protein